MLLIDNIFNYDNTFYDNIILPDYLQDKYDKLKFIDHKKMLKLSFSLKNKLAKLLFLDNFILKYNEYGKPYIQSNNITYNFSISHHDNTIVLYYNDNKNVGIDALNIDKVKLSSFKCDHFSYYEQKYCTTLDNFCKMWLVKEAYSKMIGTGLIEELKFTNFVPFLEGKIHSDISIRFLKIKNLKVCICESIIS